MSDKVLAAIHHELMSARESSETGLVSALAASIAAPMLAQHQSLKGYLKTEADDAALDRSLGLARDLINKVRRE